MAGSVFLQRRIYEWSKGLSDCQRDLLRRLAGGPLSDKDRSEVRAILLGEAGAPKPVPLELSDLPADEGEHGQVELRSVGNFRNINCLAEDQTMMFEHGLNVVYGVNGTGKTSHGRLLRRVCRAAEREDVLPNVFKRAKHAAPQTADFTISENHSERFIPIDLAQPADRSLSSISVFDASCARVFLTKPNVVDYVPRPLIILKALAQAQDGLADGLRADIDAAWRQIPELPEIPTDTAAGAALEAFNVGTDLKALEQLATLSAAETRELEELERGSAAFRADKSGELEAVARSRAGRVKTALDILRSAEAKAEVSVLRRVADLRDQLEAVTKAEHELAEHAFAGHRFPEAGQDAWRQMWFAARRFVEVGGGKFPSADRDAACPLCEQALSEDAATRFADMERFVRSDLRAQVDALTVELDAVLRSLPDIAAIEGALKSELRDVPDEIEALAVKTLEDIERRVSCARQVASGELREAASVAAVLDPAPFDEYIEEQTRLADAQAELRDDKKRAAMLTRLEELRARHSLKACLPEVKKKLRGLKEVARLEDAVRKLGTQSVSVQLRKLQEATVTDRLRTAIGDELKGLSPLGDQVVVTGKASKGEATIQLQLRDGCKEKVDRVLSAGEQGAVATAFFLAELAVSEGRSAIVLDDPVSSLDHDRRDYLAERLGREAKRRQVIVYTHDLTFMIELQNLADREDVEVHGRTLERSLDEAGIVRESLPMKGMAVSTRRKELRRQLRVELKPMFKGKKPEYEAAADLWVSDLRKGYDQLIEDYVLAGTVRRFHRHVRVKQLFQVTWTPEIANRIEEAMKVASPKSHFEAPELYPHPFTLDQLTAMLDEFDAICELTRPKGMKEEGVHHAKPTLSDELTEKVQAAGSTSAS